MLLLVQAPELTVFSFEGGKVFFIRRVRLVQTQDGEDAGVFDGGEARVGEADTEDSGGLVGLED